MGKKLQTGYRVASTTRTDLTRYKKVDPMIRFVPNFSDDPRCAPIKSYRGRLLSTLVCPVYEAKRRKT